MWLSGVSEVINAVNEGRGGPEPDLGKVGRLSSASSTAHTTTRKTVSDLCRKQESINNDSTF